jgi:hypothetical protein
MTRRERACTRAAKRAIIDPMRGGLPFVVSAVVFGLTSQAAIASAQESVSFGSVGVLVSVPFDAPLRRLGVGVEGSFHRYPDSSNPYGVGAFVQAQYLLGGGWRLDLGTQGNAIIGGAEFGVAIVAPHANDPYLGLHTALYASVGYGGVSFRWTPRLAGTAPRVHEFSLAFNAKLWWHQSDSRGVRVWETPCVSAFGCAIGRPLVVGGEVARPAVVGDVAPNDHAARWVRAMTEEYASVAAFARVSLALMALGAPAELVARTHRAALDEIDHARRCAEMAARFGAKVAPGALPEAVAPLAGVDLAELAAATVREGCVNEGAGAEEARRELTRCEDPVVREVLAVIARDEAEHARLAWDTVAWCCERGGDHVRERVAEALREMPRPTRGTALARTLRHASRRVRVHSRACAALTAA